MLLKFILYRNQYIIGAKKLAVRAPIDDVLYFIAAINQINNTIRAPSQFMKNNIPAEVAIPFPPLNNMNGLNMCPSNDNIAIAM